MNSPQENHISSSLETNPAEISSPNYADVEGTKTANKLSISQNGLYPANNIVDLNHINKSSKHHESSKEKSHHSSSSSDHKHHNHSSPEKSHKSSNDSKSKDSHKSHKHSSDHHSKKDHHSSKDKHRSDEDKHKSGDSKHKSDADKSLNEKHESDKPKSEKTKSDHEKHKSEKHKHGDKHKEGDKYDKHKHKHKESDKHKHRDSSKHKEGETHKDSERNNEKSKSEKTLENKEGDKHLKTDSEKDKLSDKHKDGEKHKDKNKDIEKHKDKHKDGEKHKEKHRDSEKHKDKHKDSEKYKDKHKDNEKHKDKQKDGEKLKDKHKDDEKHKDGEKHKEKDKYKEGKHKDKHKDGEKHRHKEGEKHKSSSDKHKKEEKIKEHHKSKHDNSSKEKSKENSYEKNTENLKIKKEINEQSAYKMEIIENENKESTTIKKEADDSFELSNLDTTIEEKYTEVDFEEKAVLIKEERMEFNENIKETEDETLDENETLEEDEVDINEKVNEEDDFEREESQNDESMDNDFEVTIKSESLSEDEMPLSARASNFSGKRKAEAEDDSEDDEPLSSRAAKAKQPPKKKKRRDSDDFSDEDYGVKKKSAKKKIKREKDYDFAEPVRKKIKKEKVSVKKEEGGDASPRKKGKVKEEDVEVWKWWEEEKMDDGQKWRTLSHKGPVFAPLYEPLPKSVKFFYNGKQMELSNEAEEVAGFYARMLDHDYTTKEAFNKNFFKDWRKVMTPAEKEIITDLSKCNFRQMAEYYKMKSEERKAMTKEEKQKIKQQNEELVKEYGFCIIDNHKQKIGNFRIEPPGLFRGRGEHPKMGMLKRRVRPEDVIINIGKGAEVPKPPDGHKWKEVRHDNTVTWLASWTENILGSTKYIMLNPSSKLKGEKDWQKYETARKLKSRAPQIREDYQQDWRAKEMKIRQRAVALYFIDKLALRAGNEKDADEAADTVGCCSLRVEHIELHKEKDGKEYVVDFDFLGKDSIRYQNSVPVEKQVFKNLKLFMENKKPGDDLFDRLNTTILNKHLNELMEGLTAKVFRTYNASKTLQEQLDLLTKPEMSIPEKFLAYNRANRAVAILCNHQRSVSKAHDKQMETLQKKIDEKEEKIEEAKRDLKKLKKEGGNAQIVERKKKTLLKLEDQLKKLEVQATDKEENKQIALGTSKLNYLDPRISVAWCKKWDVPIEKIYNKTQREKFRWAIEMADADYKF